jgi:hypothetical protein
MRHSFTPQIFSVPAIAKLQRHDVGSCAHRCYARARDAQADKLFKECLEIADKATPENVSVARLQVDTRKWAAARLAPRKYGDRVEHEVKGVSFQPSVLVQVGSVERPAELKTISHDDSEQELSRSMLK